MSILQRIFRKPGVAALSQERAPVPTQGDSHHLTALRTEFVKSALKDVLHRSGVPLGWVCFHSVTPTSSRGHAILVTLAIKHWDVELLDCSFALQKSIRQCILARDPRAINWLVGINWILAPRDESECPAMPVAKKWVEKEKAERANAAAASVYERREELNLLLAKSDEAMAALGPRDFEHTRPMDSLM